MEPFFNLRDVGKINKYEFNLCVDDSKEVKIMWKSKKISLLILLQACIIMLMLKWNDVVGNNFLEHRRRSKFYDN